MSLRPPTLDERAALLEETRRRKMARSPHAFVRGNTIQFYNWLESLESSRLPHGPSLWICGDCHIGNLGPIAGVDGRPRIQIRDVDQTVIGNPAHDLIRLALSLASAARGSNLPGVTTARMLEAVIEGYETAFERDVDGEEDDTKQPESVRVVMREASKRTWKHLARERLEDTKPTIPLGKRFWPTSPDERAAIDRLIADPAVAQLATMLRTRADGAAVEVLDAAYWMKGCSSLGKLRYAVLLAVTDDAGGTEYCLMDIKEAVAAAAPAYPGVEMPTHHGERVAEGARRLTPRLGERLRAATLLDRPVFIRELLPQDLKLEIERLSAKQATRAARFLAGVVGHAHARQMDAEARRSWQDELHRHRSKAIDAPSWLWSSVVELLVEHEGSYLEHCRRHLLATITP